MQNYILSLIFWTPLFGAIFILFPFKQHIFRWVAVAVLSVELLWVGLMLYMAYSHLGQNTNDTLLLSEKTRWWSVSLGEYGYLQADYFLGVDAKNILLVALSAVVLWISAWASFNVVRQRLYFLLYLLLSSAIMGTFLSLDFLLFFICFEFMLLPMYFLIGLWGGKKREYAAIKFFIYTLLGSILILIAGLIIVNSGIDIQKTAAFLQISSDTILQQLHDGTFLGKQIVHSFDMLAFKEKNYFLPQAALFLYEHNTMRIVVFGLLVLGFAIKLPLAPLHTWLPIAHVEAATPISMVLAGILLKIGGYGLLRLPFAIFTDVAAEYALWLGAWGVFSILYGAFLALGQGHLKRLIAYSSVSHMGFVLLGLAVLNKEGEHGAMYQMLSHGIISPLLFFLVGVMYHQTQDLTIEKYRGLFFKVKNYTILVSLAFFAGLGLPTFSSFIAELTVLLGAFSSDVVPKWIGLLAALGLLLTASYFLWAFKRMFLGEYWLHQDLRCLTLKDINFFDKAIAIVLIALSFLLGIFPQLVFGWLN